MVLRHDATVARFAHRLALHLIQPALNRKGIRSLPLVRLLLLNKRKQLFHQLDLGCELLSNVGIDQPPTGVQSFRLGNAVA